MARLDDDLVGLAVFLRFALPPGDLLDTPLGVLVQRNAEAFDEVGPVALDEPGRVFREMFRAFGHEMAQPHQHLVAHLVGTARVPVAGLRKPPLAVALLQRGVEVAIAPVRLPMLEIEVEGHVVDPAGAVADLLDGNVEVARQFPGRALHRMAKTHLPHIGILRPDRPGVDRHRVHVLQHDRPRRVLADVLGHLPQHRHRPQPPHDPADAQRVGNRLAQAELLGHLEIGHRAGLVTADLETADNEIRPRDGAGPVGIGLDLGMAAQRLGHLAHHDLRFLEPLGIDVHQPHGRALQRLAAQDVAGDVLGEDGAARPDERDDGRCHVASSLLCRPDRAGR